MLTKPSAIQSEFTYDSDTTVPFLNSYINGYDSTTMVAGGTASAQNAADYTLTMALASTTNFKWNDNTTAQFQINWKIKAQKIAKPTASKTSFVYSGEPIVFLDETGGAGGYVTGFNPNKMQKQSGSSSWTAVSSRNVIIALVNTTNYNWADGSTDPVQINWEITPKLLAKPYCKYADTNIQWTGSNINWLEYAIVDYDSTAMKCRTTPEVEGRFYGYDKTNIGDYFFWIVPKDNNFTWDDGTSDAIKFQWSIVRKRLSGSDDGYFYVDNGTGYNKNEFYYTPKAGNRPTANIVGYNPDVHNLFKTAEGGTKTTSLNLEWTVGEYTWGIEPKDNYAWSDGTYGRQTFKVKVTKSPISVVFDSGYDTCSNGSGTVFESVCELKITDSDVMSSATYGIGRTVTFHYVDYAGNTITGAASSSDVTLDNGSTSSYTATYSASGSYSVKIYGLGNGGDDIFIRYTETTNYQGTLSAGRIRVTVDRSLSSVQNWTKIHEICQSGALLDYVKGDETYPVQLSGTVGTVSVSGKYLAQLVDYDYTTTTWAICKKEGVSGHIAFADSYYGTLVTNGAKAFAHITDTAESTTYENSALRSRANEFYNVFSTPAKSYLTANAWNGAVTQNLEDKIIFWFSNGYFYSGNKAPFKHFTSGTEVKVWETMEFNATEARAFTFNGSSSTVDFPDLHMSLGLVPIFTVG